MHNSTLSNLHTFKKVLDKQLDELFKREANRVEEDYNNSHSNFAFEQIQDFTMRGGKRVRSALTFYTYMMLSGGSYDQLIHEKTLLQICMCVELINCQLLMVDDFNDLSVMRRGAPTVHKQFTQQYSNLSHHNSAHLGNSLAIVTSLIAGFMALNLINTSQLNNEVKIKLHENLMNKLDVTGYGQLLDILNDAQKLPSEEEILKAVKWKTAAYTFENPVHMGAILAGADTTTLEALSQYALNAGIAFQLQDDIIGVFGDPEQTGKAVGEDIADGRITLLILETIKSLSENDRERFLELHGKENINEDEINEVKNFIKSSGALMKTSEKAETLATTAKEALKKVRQSNWSDEGYDFLIGVVDFVISRNR